MARTTQWLSPQTLVQVDQDEKSVAISHDAGETWQEIYRDKAEEEAPAQPTPARTKKSREDT